MKAVSYSQNLPVARITCEETVGSSRPPGGQRWLGPVSFFVVVCRLSVPFFATVCLPTRINHPAGERYTGQLPGIGGFCRTSTSTSAPFFFASPSRRRRAATSGRASSLVVNALPSHHLFTQKKNLP